MPTAWALHSGAIDLRRVARLGTTSWAQVTAAAGGGGGVGSTSTSTHSPRSSSSSSSSSSSGRPVHRFPGWDAPGSFPLYSEVDCCHKRLGVESVIFEDCRPADVMRVNYTRSVYRQCAVAAGGGGGGGTLHWWSARAGWIGGGGGGGGQSSSSSEQQREDQLYAADLSHLQERRQRGRLGAGKAGYLVRRTRWADGAWNESVYAACPP